MSIQQKLIVANGDMSGDITSTVVDLGSFNLGSIQSVFSGAPVGSLILEISDDIVLTGQDPQSVVTHWDSYGNAQAIVAAGSYTFNIPYEGYKWIRLRFSHTVGSVGTLNSTLVAKTNA